MYTIIILIKKNIMYHSIWLLKSQPAKDERKSTKYHFSNMPKCTIFFPIIFKRQKASKIILSFQL